MTRIEIPITAFSTQSAAPDRKYGQLANLPLLATAAEVFFRAPLRKIPDGATVNSATVRFYGRSDESGSRTLNVQPTATQVDGNIRWSKRPGGSGATVTVTKASPQRADAWDFDVTASVQNVVSGTRVDYGWHLWQSTTTAVRMLVGGSMAPVRKPVLIVDYSTLPDSPDNLAPSSGAVDVASPVLTFDGDDNITNLQVQVDAAMNDIAPAFDTGSLAAAAGFLDLSTTSYTGLAAGATTYWRARQKTAGGWSDWSDWVSMTRLTKSTLTILNPPAGNIDDGTPPVQWSFDGTQVAWQARFLNASGDVLDDSGYTPGTDTDWTPDKGLKVDGRTGTIEVLVWDDKDRVATPGSPEYVLASRSVTYNLDPTVDPMLSLSASQSHGTPDVTLSGRRAEMPDQVVVFRDGEQLGIWDGPDVFTGQALTFVDPNPPMGQPVTYRVAPRVNGKTAKGGPTVTITPHAAGIWLQSVDTGDRVMLYVDDGTVPEQSQPESAIVHTPLNPVDGLGQVVRRRLIRMRPQGTVKGVIMDEGGYQPGIPDAATAEALMRSWADDGDAGDIYWLTFSGYTGTVIVGDLEFSELDNFDQDNGRMLGVTFNYWGQA